MLPLLTILITSYFIGSIPVSIIICRWLKGIDIRDHGSGNAGATNVYRVMGWKIALGVFLLDVLKGLLAVNLALLISVDPNIISILNLKIGAGMFSIIGHVWTIFARFKGGKGIGTSLGVFLSLLPIPVLAAFAVWLIVMGITKYVSVASLSAGLCLPVFTYIKMHFWYEEINLMIFSIIIGTLVWITHIPNINRLIQGNEKGFGKRN